MAKKKNIVKTPEDKASVENIDVFWEISEHWNDLTYEQKLERYWKYSYIDGKRIYPEYDAV